MVEQYDGDIGDVYRKVVGTISKAEMAESCVSIYSYKWWKCEKNIGFVMGSGERARDMRKIFNAHVVGIDSSKKQIEAAQQVSPGEGIEFKCLLLVNEKDQYCCINYCKHLVRKN